MGDADADTGRAGDRRERRREALRQRVADGALRLAMEHGADAVTVEQISDVADIAPRTFFNYFPSREDALLPAQEARLEVLRAALAERVETTDPVTGAWQALTGWALTGHLAEADALPRLRVALQSRTLNPRYLARYAAIETVIADHLSSRLGADPAAVLRCASLAAALIGVFRAAVRCWALDPAGDGRDLTQVLDEAFAAAFGAPGRS